MNSFSLKCLPSRWLAALAALYFTLAGPAIARDAGVVKTSPTAFSVPDSTSLLDQADLRIGPLDKIKVVVFGVEDLTAEYQVDENGRIKFPLIGETDVKGFKAAELATELERLYGQTYIQKPDINVLVTDSASGMVTVDGAVMKPGMFPVRGQMSLLQTVAQAGGLAQVANPKRVLVFRNIEGRRHAAVFNLKEIRKGRAEDPTIYGNDVIVVDGGSVAEGYREFLRSVPVWALFVAM